MYEGKEKTGEKKENHKEHEKEMEGRQQQGGGKRERTIVVPWQFEQIVYCSKFHFDKQKIMLYFFLLYIMNFLKPILKNNSTIPK